jgi:hypothetical protein
MNRRTGEMVPFFYAKESGLGPSGLDPPVGV